MCWTFFVNLPIEIKLTLSTCGKFALLPYLNKICYSKLLVNKVRYSYTHVDNFI